MDDDRIAIYGINIMPGYDNTVARNFTSYGPRADAVSQGFCMRFSRAASGNDKQNDKQ